MSERRNASRSSSEGGSRVVPSFQTVGAADGSVTRPVGEAGARHDAPRRWQEEEEEVVEVEVEVEMERAAAEPRRAPSAP